MLITKKVIIKNNSVNKFYLEKGLLNNENNTIELEVFYLKNFSKVKVDVSCDICGVIKNIFYYSYIKCTKNGKIYTCGGKCASIKSKKTNLERYGVSSPAKNLEILNKMQTTCIDKYGVKNPFQSKEIQEKSKQSNLDKYGVENISKSEIIKEKKKDTTFKNYGVEYTLRNLTLLNKVKQTNFKKYGVSSYSKTDECKNKVKQNNLDKYGVEHFTQSELSKLITIIGQHPNYIKYIDNNISLFDCDLNKNHVFEIHCDNFHSRLKSNLPLCTICYPIGNSRSLKEEIIYEYIKSIYSGEIIQSYRDGLEIDIYLPELKTGIEFNGLYWHSGKFKENDYHINKLNLFKERQIDIKFIYEDDFDNNLTIIKSQISNWLGLTQTKIYARKCEVKQIVYTEEYKDFLNSNHIQGFVPSKLVYGLYYKNQLVSLMCFDKKEGRLNMKGGEWNLNRFCNLLNHQVIGGASKLLNYFIKENNPKRVISYADKDWSNGNLYFTLGFKLLSESKPDYKYIVDGIRKSKQNFTKTKLSKMGHDISLTESQIMENIGINKIYDCGKMKFELLINKEDNI